MAAGYQKLQHGRDKIIQYLTRQKVVSQLADKLLGAKFITDGVYDQAKNFAPGVVERDRVTVLFDAVLAGVELNPSKYKKFLDILKTIGGLEDIVVFIEGDGDSGGNDGGDDGSGKGPGGIGGAAASVVIEPLTTADHLDITTYLFGADPNILQQLGIVLGIDPNRLRNPQSPSFVNDLVSLWLQRVDQVDARGGPTWATLEKALRHRTVGMTGPANDVKKEQLQH